MNTTPPPTPRPNFGPGYRVASCDAIGPTSSPRRELAEKLSARIWPSNTGQIAVTLPLGLYINIIAALERE